MDSNNLPSIVSKEDIPRLLDDGTSHKIHHIGYFKATRYNSEIQANETLERDKKEVREDVINLGKKAGGDFIVIEKQFDKFYDSRNQHLRIILVYEKLR